LPGLDGQLLTCEPAQNFVRRSIVERDGAVLRLRRAKGEEQREFLTSSDPWFHPIALAIAPDGTVCVVDFYREIIEDYSAIPRYLQQQYGLVAGHEHGRLWRLAHETAPAAAAADLCGFSGGQLVAELDGDNYWRRRTAQRLLVERQDKSVADDLSRLVREAKRPQTVLAALYALDGLGSLDDDDILVALDHTTPAVRVHGLRLGERFVDSRVDVLGRTLALIDGESPEVRLQAALSIGESRVPTKPVGSTPNSAGWTRRSSVLWPAARANASVSCCRVRTNSARPKPCSNRCRGRSPRGATTPSCPRRSRRS
jgi:hypothetical protein